MTWHIEQNSFPYPLALGEGQVDMAIKHHNQGEVLMTERIE